MQKRIYPLLALLLALSLGCSLFQGRGEDAERIEGTVPTEEARSPTATPRSPTPTRPAPTSPLTTEPAAEPGAVIRQWAVYATASSEYGNPAWSAMQATGAPDTPECGDFPTAWASAEPDGYDWLELHYAQPVIPIEINIHETHSPGFIYKVLLKGTTGEEFVIVEGGVHTPDVCCPQVLNVKALGIESPVDRVLIVVDQRAGGNWNEIDAVELVGIAGDFPASVGDVDIVNRRLWRIRTPEDFDDDAFISLGGIALGANGLLYVADGDRGVYVFDAETGGGIARISDDALLWAADVTLAPDGTLYVADPNAHAIFRFAANGAPLGRFGRQGTGRGEFGTSSPYILAAGPDGNLYVLDHSNGARVLIFNGEGVFQRSFALPGDDFDARDLSFGPDGNLYVLGAVGGYIEAYDREGKQVGYAIGEEELWNAWPQRLTLDAAGNFYVACVSPEPHILRLDPDGFATGRFGPDLGVRDPRLTDETLSWPGALAVQPDGARLFVADLGDWFTIFALTLEAGQ